MLRSASGHQYPEGYYPFEEDPLKSPPRVRKPPYTQTEEVCSGVLEAPEQVSLSLDNLCGDLNTGLLPRNPLGQNVLGASYPFELIKNQTLNLFSKALPVLKEDKTLPKVAKFVSSTVPLSFLDKKPTKDLDKDLFNAHTKAARNMSLVDYKMDWMMRMKFEIPGGKIQEVVEGSSQIMTRHCGRVFYRFCLLYNTMMGKETTNPNPIRATERRDKVEPSGNSIEDGAPLTPCPSAVEYVTPVFARNYQGVWRYVVQIPYEGYFTQTVEITQCLEDTCHYLSGSCLASPRWVSLLVAEIFYPDAVFPSKPTRPSLQRSSVHPSQPRRPQRRRREADMKPPAPHYCDGVDQIGCFQVRLYYDWFLVPGSCKCWKRNVFQQNFRHRR
ncbi:hypothetical protein HAZT_HAZT005884 [Hyalella azteca]|uniref:Spaetzle domain-containing protein n=1 Tax=Hyalella azteca TaxID=294128 RepID=A0A6A0HC90_HYAAZ|nr:hypothetical protein HAZT_HAZT005884 [Hyalella azteca]